ncbi:MAG: glycoside hydrolase family 127 protein [Lentisphaeria bacterium]|nr:glycoside hydrolase family 127 protein [Lentisphaeria bacterium]
MSFTELPPGVVRLHGPLGQALKRVIENRLKKINYRQLVDPFRFRNETDLRWRCEFWGKVVRSAVYAWRATGDPELGKLLENTVADLLSTQSADGVISSYPDALRTRGWDVWGRKYLLAGLNACLREYGKDPQVIAAAGRMLDALLRDTRGGVFQDYGEHFGLAGASILRHLTDFAVISGKEKYLDAAKKLASCGCCHLHDIFYAARQMVPPMAISNGKAYEMTSCFQGACVLGRLLNDPGLRDAAKCYWELLRGREIAVTGAGGMKDRHGEFWYDGKFNQHRSDMGSMGETCVTVTWLSFCRDMLAGEENSVIADAMERAFYNAMLGSVSPDGAAFTHANPFLDGGWKKPAQDQMADFPGHDCCLAQGPFGLALAPCVAVMRSSRGYVVNLYEDLSADGILRIKGNYPSSGRVKITVEKTGGFELLLRIPGDFACRVEGRQVPGGAYLPLLRQWRAGDAVEVEFDLSERLEYSCDGKFSAALAGPLVLCRCAKQPEKHLFRSRDRFDYASAGSRFAAEDVFTVWEKSSGSGNPENKNELT